MATMSYPKRSKTDLVVPRAYIIPFLVLFLSGHCQSFRPVFSRRSSVLISSYRKYSSPLLSLTANALTSLEDSQQQRVAVKATLFDQQQKQLQNEQKPSRSLSLPAQWHRQRRQEMLQKYRDQIAPLERFSDSQSIGLILLALSNLTLAALSIVCGSLPIFQVVLLSIFPGSILSLWQLQILHDNIHGCLLDKQKQSFSIPILLPTVTWSKRQLQDAITFWGSMPSFFGYYLYLKYGHVSHHALMGSASLEQAFASTSRDLDDGDVLFVAHRMKLLGKIGPTISWRNTDTTTTPTDPSNNINNNNHDKNPSSVNDNNSITLSISRAGFSFWKPNQPVWNAFVFIASFMFERILLGFNDVVVALTGRNFFFPNKPIQDFQEPCALYSRCAVLVRLSLLLLGGSWKSLLFLYLAETLWSIPPHPACAMFITNHGSSHQKQNDEDNNNNSMEDDESSSTACIPTSSTYAGSWYSILTLGTNYHTEHHDFPTIPFHRLGRLHQIAPEYYTLHRSGDSPANKDNIWKIMAQAFAKPNYYACMNDLHLAGSTGSASAIPTSSGAPNPTVPTPSQVQ